MHNKSRTRMALRLSAGAGGASSGKNFSTSSSMLNLPSATARPTAVDVKLLLSEYNTCGVSAAYGVHHPSATTEPCRTSMKLFISGTCRSAAWMKSKKILQHFLKPPQFFLRLRPPHLFIAGQSGFQIRIKVYF